MLRLFGVGRTVEIGAFLEVVSNQRFTKALHRGLPGRRRLALHHLTAVALGVSVRRTATGEDTVSDDGPRVR